MIIYTDEDVRPDLLTPSEREQFPEVLDNSDRRAILTVTRERMDNIDMDGHLMPPAKEWLDSFGTPEAEGRPEYKTVITRTVASPYTAETAEVPAGIADTVQRLLDRGVGIALDRCKSYMMTDHPGCRWIGDQIRPGGEKSVIPGQHMYRDSRYLPYIEFPVDNVVKGANTDRMAGLLKQAAAECGLVIEDVSATGQTKSQLRLTFPCCLDGTSQKQALFESTAMAREQGLPADYQQRLALYTRCADMVRIQHGGAALYSDAMIQDRFARFARSLERLIIQHPDLSRGEKPESHYENYLTGHQMDSIQKLCDSHSLDLYDRIIRPNVYRQYADSPETVDAVARQAGYHSYIDFLDNQRERTGTPDKRWSEYRRLERQLHPDLQGRLLIFRLSEGIRRQVIDYRNQLTLNQAKQTQWLYQSCGYPLERMKGITFLQREDGSADMYLELDGKPVVRQVNALEMTRLRLNAVTPLEVALSTCGHEVGWHYKPHILVSEDTLHAVTSRWQQTGNHPLVMDRTHDVYPVSEAAWEHARLLTRYEQLPASLADKIASKTEVYNLPADKLRQRIDRLTEKLSKELTGIQADGATADSITFNYRYQGKLCCETINLKELDFSRKLLPGVVPDNVVRELFAGRVYEREELLMAGRGSGRSR